MKLSSSWQETGEGEDVVSWLSLFLLLLHLDHHTVEW